MKSKRGLSRTEATQAKELFKKCVRLTELERTAFLNQLGRESKLVADEVCKQLAAYSEIVPGLEPVTPKMEPGRRRRASVPPRKIVADPNPKLRQENESKEFKQLILVFVFGCIIGGALLLLPSLMNTETRDPAAVPAQAETP